MKFESLGECGSYLRGVIVLDVSLPEKVPFCQYCPMCKYEESMRRYSCRAMQGKEWIFSPFSGRPQWCPIQFEEEEE